MAKPTRDMATCILRSKNQRKNGILLYQRGVLGTCMASGCRATQRTLWTTMSMVCAEIERENIRVTDVYTPPEIPLSGLKTEIQTAPRALGPLLSTTTHNGRVYLSCCSYVRADDKGPGLCLCLWSTTTCASRKLTMKRCVN